MLKKIVFGIILAFVFLSLISIPTLAFDFYGYTKYPNGTVMNATNITVDAYTFSPSGPLLEESKTALSNESGWFNVTGITENDTWFYKPVVLHFNDTSENIYADYVGASLPEFPMGELNATSPVTFYLKNGTTINISAVNTTGGIKPFNYQVKDKTLGYPIAENFSAFVDNIIVHVPQERNYSIMIFPNETFPVSTDVSNPSSYYSKTFNCTESLDRLTGYMTATSISGFDSIKVLVYIIEPGRMLFFGDDAPALYNFSEDDDYNTTSGFYNISVVVPFENSTMIAFAVAVNGTDYYGSFKEIPLNYGSSPPQTNMTLEKFLGSESNVSVTTGSGPQNITIKKMTFNLFNSTNHSLSDFAFVEVELDYDDYNMTNFTFAVPVDQTSNGTFRVPLMNQTGIKKLNIYASQVAPTKKSYTAEEINSLSQINITMKDAMNMEDPEGELLGDLFVDMVVHNSTCDIPYYDVGCSYFGGEAGKENIHPLTIVMSGAPISFRMKNANNITVHYVKVDLLASGPPDALFDSDSTDTSEASTFEQAWKFGSTGPKIYDYVIIGIPYTEGSASVTGFDESQDISIGISRIYDDDFNEMWDRAQGGTISDINTNDTLIDFRDYLNTSYEFYLNGTGVVCSVTDSTLASNLCYKDTTNNMLWFKIPHFTGIGPEPSGTLYVYSNGGTPGGGGAMAGIPSGPTISTKTGGANVTIALIGSGKSSNFTIQKTEELAFREMNITVVNTVSVLRLYITKLDAKPASVTHEISGKVYHYINIDKENVEDADIDKVKIKFAVKKNWINNNNIDPNTVKLNRWTGTGVTGSFLRSTNSALEIIHSLFLQTLRPLGSITGLVVSGDQWTELTTTKISETTDEILYEAESPGFSVFAIIGEEIVEVSPEEVEGEVEEVGEVTELTPPTIDIGTAIAVVVILLAILAASLWYSSRYKKSKK